MGFKVLRFVVLFELLLGVWKAPLLVAQDDVAFDLESITSFITEYPEDLRLELVSTAERYGARNYIPYVWGGRRIADTQTCLECRTCLAKEKVRTGKAKSRECTACKKCGVDCSHFVNLVFREAGLPYPYISTKKMRQLSRERLRRNLLIDIGRNLGNAKAGDLLVHESHVMLLLRDPERGFGDYVHVNRPVKKGRIGGVEIVRDADLSKHRGGRLIKILRHIGLEKDAAFARK